MSDIYSSSVEEEAVESRSKAGLQATSGFVSSNRVGESPLDGAPGLSFQPFGDSQKERLFLLSGGGTAAPKVLSEVSHAANHKQDGGRTNRKPISMENDFHYKGEVFRVNAKPSGLFTHMMQRIIDQLDIALGFYSRVLAIRFDLHQKVYTPSNKQVTQFMKKLLPSVYRRYGKTKVGYVWAREHERALAQHYHGCIWIDGNLVRHPSNVIEMIREAWLSVVPDGHVPTIENPYYFVNSAGVRKELVYRLSYLAKVRGKGVRPAQVKDYQTSRLKNR